MLSDYLLSPFEKSLNSLLMNYRNKLCEKIFISFLESFKVLGQEYLQRKKGFLFICFFVVVSFFWVL